MKESIPGFLLPLPRFVIDLPELLDLMFQCRPYQLYLHLHKPPSAGFVEIGLFPSNFHHIPPGQLPGGEGLVRGRLLAVLDLIDRPMAGTIFWALQTRQCSRWPSTYCVRRVGFVTGTQPLPFPVPPVGGCFQRGKNFALASGAALHCSPFSQPQMPPCNFPVAAPPSASPA